MHTINNCIKHRRNISYDDNLSMAENQSPFRNNKKPKFNFSSDDLSKLLEENENPDHDILNEEENVRRFEPLDIEERNSEEIINRHRESKNYLHNLLGFFYYTLISNLSVIIINGCTQSTTVYGMDNFAFLFLSPIFYKLCFREIFVYHYQRRNKKNLAIVYPFFIIFGFGIRLLDRIPTLSKFVLNTDRFDYDSPLHLILFWMLILYLFFVFINELYYTRYRLFSFILLVSGMVFIFLITELYLKRTYTIHIHHYFIGLLLHIICQTKRSKISFLNNAVGFGIFLEGITAWGYGELYKKQN